MELPAVRGSSASEGEGGSAPVKTVLRHGSVVIAAITSCTNTSNPSVMLAAGLVAKKAADKGLKVGGRRGGRRSERSN